MAKFKMLVSEETEKTIKAAVRKILDEGFNWSNFDQDGITGHVSENSNFEVIIWYDNSDNYEIVNPSRPQL